MAVFHPSIDYIKKHKHPSEEEKNVLNFLSKNLDDSFEIFFKTSVNTSIIDVIILRKGYGIVIIKITDWFENCLIDVKRLKKSPVKVIEEQKAYFFDLHSLILFRKRFENSKAYGLIGCSVYFKNKTEEEIINKLNQEKYELKNNIIYTNYTSVLGSNSLTSDKLYSLLKNFHLISKNQSIFFTNDLYYEFKNLLNPVVIFSDIEKKKVYFSEKQQRFVESREGIRQKIKGVAGAGKTLVLSQRAVNGYIRTEKRVLVLTFNITLRNYIKEKIISIQDEVDLVNFDIIHYHEFFKIQANNYGLNLYNCKAWDDVNFFKSVKDYTEKYDVVLIDEVQDYEKEWLYIIYEYFTHKDTEIVLFGDEKQNIYKRTLENKQINTGIIGAWNKLNKSYRLNSSITVIANNFQKTFLETKYDLEEIEIQEELLLSDDSKNILEYHYFESSDKKIEEKVFNVINKIIKTNNLNFYDSCILSNQVNLLLEIEYLINTENKMKTLTTFENKNVHNQLTKKYFSVFSEKQKTNDLPDYQTMLYNFKKEINKIRKIKKFHFKNEKDKVKLSTTHSFKGWEIPTLFLIIENNMYDDFLVIDLKKNTLIEKSDSSNKELIYTGITRAKNNLIIINLGNDKYHEFFKREFKNTFEHNDKS